MPVPITSVIKAAAAGDRGELMLSSPHPFHRLIPHLQIAESYGLEVAF
jgi:hypothetical protein